MSGLEENLNLEGQSHLTCKFRRQQSYASQGFNCADDGDPRKGGFELYKLDCRQSMYDMRRDHTTRRKFPTPTPPATSQQSPTPSPPVSLPVPRPLPVSLPTIPRALQRLQVPSLLGRRPRRSAGSKPSKLTGLLYLFNNCFVLVFCER